MSQKQPTKQQLMKVAAAGAFGLAAFHLQNAILTTLVAKGILTTKEAALTISGAIHELDNLHPTPSDSDLGSMARHVLTTLSQGWDAQARGN
jgi:hypothetical protein